jgi:hypothetical protein
MSPRIDGDDPTQVDWREIYKSDKGTLLYRQIIPVRCHFAENPDMNLQETIVTIYHHNSYLNIEVLLYKDASKMSIAASTPAHDLFGIDPSKLSFKEIL